MNILYKNMIVFVFVLLCGNNAYAMLGNTMLGKEYGKRSSQHDLADMMFRQEQSQIVPSWIARSKNLNKTITRKSRINFAYLQQNRKQSGK